MSTVALIRLLDETAVALSTADPTSWTADESDEVLEALGPAAIEVVGLAARIRAAKVNGTPVPRPAPARRVDPPPDPETTPPPDHDPPPPPPPSDGGGS